MFLLKASMKQEFFRYLCVGFCFGMMVLVISVPKNVHTTKGVFQRALFGRVLHRTGITYHLALRSLK